MGGASSSASLAPLGAVVSRTGEARASERWQWMSETACGSLRREARPATSFDDPEEAAWECEELDVPLAHPHTVEELLVDDPFREVEADLGSLQRFEAELQAYLPNAPEERPSAMSLWDVCPALVEGLLELPRIEEDEADQGFCTVEGWKVRDPTRAQAVAEASARAQRHGIQGLLGVSGGTATREIPASSHRILPAARVQARLAHFSSADLPLPPPIEELEEPLNQGTAVPESSGLRSPPRVCVAAQEGRGDARGADEGAGKEHKTPMR